MAHQWRNPAVRNSSGPGLAAGAQLRHYRDERERPTLERFPGRSAVRLACVVTSDRRPPREAIIHDLSFRGFGLTTADQLMIGSRVEIDIPGVGRVGAIVRWSLCDRAGGQFE